MCIQAFYLNGNDENTEKLHVIKKVLKIYKHNYIHNH